MKIFSKKLIASILTIIMCVSSVAFVAAENSDAITISATETTTINLDDATLNDKIEVNHNGTGNYKFGTGAAATFTVNVEEAGSYKMRANILTRDQYMNTWNVYIDDVKHGTFYSWITAGFWCDNEVLDLYFDEAGEHTIKIDMTLGNAYLNNFTLTKEEYDFKSISILGKNATGTGFANNMEKYQITNGNNANQYAEYSVNIETDGVYRITSQTTYNETELKSALLTVNGKDIGTVNIKGVTRGSYGDEKAETVLGEVFLNAGDNKIRITNKDYPSGQVLMITMLMVDKISDDSSLPTEEPGSQEPIGEIVRIPMKSFTNSSSLSRDDLVSFEQEKWAEFNIDIETTGKYRFGMKFGGLTGDTQGFKVSVNGEEKLTASVEVENDYFTPGDVVIGDILFDEAGTNVLKIENIDSSGILVEDIYIQLVEEVTITPEPTEEPTETPEVDAMGENIRIHMRDYIAAYRANGGTSELGQDGSNPDNTLWQVNDWAEYALNITTPGTYEFGLCLGGNAAQVQKLTASVDGVEQLVADVTIADAMGAGIPKKDVVFGNITFATPGIHTLKIKKTDGSFIYSSHVFLNLTDSSEIRIPTGSYVEANSSRASGALDYEGGYYCLRSGDWAKYNVYIATPGKYKLGIKESGNTGQTAKLKASVNGVEQFNNNSKTPLSGMWAQFADVEYGEVTFAYSGTNELLIENTGTSDGEYTMNIYLVLLEELDEGANVPDVPETTEIRLHMANDSYEKYCNLTGANDLKIEGGCVTWHGKGDSSPIGDWAKFKVDIEDAGVYRFGLELSGTVGGITALRVEVDGEEKIESTQKTITTYYGTLTDTVFGTLEFDEPGEYDIYVEHTGTSGQYVGHIFLTHLGDALEISDVKAGGVDLTEENVVPVGTDLIMVSFSKLIKNSEITGENCKISLKDSKGNSVAISPSVVKGTAMIALKEALKLDETYTLSVGAISDSVENSMSVPAKYVFTTEEGDAVAFIREAEATFNETVAEVKATMFSSQNIGIKGRAFEAFVEDPNGNVTVDAIASGVSGDDGIIEFKYSIPSGSVDGEYTFIIKGEYVSSDAKVDAVYVSDNLRQTIEDAINDAASASDVEEIIAQNKEYLGIEPTSFVAGLDASKVYKHFTEKDTTFENIVSDFETYAAVEKFNQATSSNIDDVAKDESNWDAIGIDYNMFNILSTDEKTVVKDAILALEDGMTTDEFVEAVYNIIQNSLRADNSKENLTPDISDMNAYIGQGIYLPIKFAEEYSDVKALSYTIKVLDEELLENASVKLNVPATVTTDVSDDLLTVEILFDSTVSNGNLGNIILTAPSSTGEYDITLNGGVNYLFEQEDISFIIEADINEKTVELNVVKTPSNASGNTSSSPKPNYKPSTGGGGNGGGNSSTPIVTPPATEYAFSDLATNHWAYPAVDYLLDNGIIEKTADKLFKPETAINREEIVKMLVLGLGLTDKTAESNLTDVTKDNPYYVYIASAEKLGIIKGNDIGKFMIGTQITREDICVIIHRAVSTKMNLTASDEVFVDDNAISDYAKKAIYEMRGAGLINGMGNNEFAPKGAVTKAQAVKMIYEIVKAVAK